MNKQTAAKALRLAHLVSAITVGICVAGMEVAPMRILIVTAIAAIVLGWSYHRLYYIEETGQYKPFSDTPIDDEVRRDLGIKD